MISLISMNLEEDFAHRLLFILEDLKEELKLKKFISSTLSSSDIKQGLSRILSKTDKKEI